MSVTRDDIGPIPSLVPRRKSYRIRSSRGGVFDLYVRASNAAGSDELLYESMDNKRPTSWSADGRYLLFDIPLSNARGDLWALPIDGDRKPCNFPFWNSVANQFGKSEAWFLLPATAAASTPAASTPAASAEPPAMRKATSVRKPAVTAAQIAPGSEPVGATSRR